MIEWINENCNKYYKSEVMYIKEIHLFKILKYLHFIIYILNILFNFNLNIKFNNNLLASEKRGNRFRRSIQKDGIELSPVVKLIHSPDTNSEYGGTIDIPISSDYQKPNETNLMTNFELEIVQSQSKDIWRIHFKKIEAFCNEWKDMLWIDWILGDNHKQHNFEGIDKAASKQKELMETNYSKVLNTK